MAFQIADDLLDYTGSEDVTGKPAGLDLHEHKITLPLIAAIPNMDPGERTIAEDLMTTATPTEAQIHELIAIVEERGGIEAARTRAGHFAREAEAELDRIPVSRARDALRDGVSYVVERRS